MPMHLQGYVPWSTGAVPAGTWGLVDSFYIPKQINQRRATLIKQLPEKTMRYSILGPCRVKVNLKVIKLKRGVMIPNHHKISKSPS